MNDLAMWQAMPQQNKKEVIDLIKAFKTDIDKRYSWYRAGVDYTFAHIVLADYNLSNAHIDGCFKPSNIEMWDKTYGESYKEILDGQEVWAEDFMQLKAEIADFLNYLKTIPEQQRCE